METMRLIKKMVLVLSCVMAVAPAFSQDKEKIPTVTMTVQGTAGKDSVRMTELSADVQVVGNVATTTLDMIFYNSSSRFLEGEFEFPLAEGQSVCGYALDIDGKMRNGVVVEKDKARTVFEDKVRQNVDPGLLEVTRGNNFKTRIYPLPANGSRHVRIAYSEELPLVAGARTYSLNPLTNAVLDSFSFKIAVCQQQGGLQVGGTDTSFIHTGYNGSFTKQKYSFKTPVTVSIPVEPVKNGTAPVFTQEVGTDTYFYSCVPVSESVKEKKLPQKLTVFYDVSASAGAHDIDAEMELLRSYISKLKSPAVTVIPFCNELQGARNFQGASVAADAEAFIRSLQYDGASNLAYDFAHLWYEAGEVLLFSDGIGNWRVPEKSGAVKRDASVLGENVVYTINSSANADHAFLQQLAQKNGGVYINLCSRTPSQALELLTHEHLRLIRAEYNAKAVEELYPLPGTVVTGEFSVVGVLKKKSDIIRLSFGYGNEVTESVSVPVSALTKEQVASAPEHIARLWAQKKIDALSVSYDSHRDEILSLSKKYGIVTKETSLLVLETVEDYVRYEVEPPEDLRDDYNRIMSARQSAEKPAAKETGIPDSVYQNFEAFRKWWETPVENVQKPKKEKNSSGLFGFNRRRRDSEPEVAEQSSRETSSSGGFSLDSILSAPRRAMKNSMEAAVAKSSGAPVDAASPTAATIVIQPWNPDADYLAVLKRTPTEAMYAKYLELRPSYVSSPAFYMEVSSYFMEEELSKEAVRILSNLAEMHLENTDVLRALGNKLVEFGLYYEAAWVFEQLTVMRPEVPQFFRDLGLAYAGAGKYQQAVEALYHVASRQWDKRYSEIQQIALNDMNAIIAAHPDVDTSALDKKLVQNFPVDIRVVLTWNTDDCDIDLWVTDPNAEKCYYAHKQTDAGGRMSRDFTQGYGPEEFCIRNAVRGEYKIEANYYGTRSQKVLQPVVVQAEVYTKYGTGEQQKQILTLQLENIKGSYTVGTVTF